MLAWGRLDGVSKPRVPEVLRSSGTLEFPELPGLLGIRLWSGWHLVTGLHDMAASIKWGSFFVSVLII